MAKNDDKTALVFSYFPMSPLDLDEKRFFDPSEIPTVAEMFTKRPNSNARACIWTSHDGVPTPVLVYPEATKIANHLLEWCENKPSEWFTLNIIHKLGIYGLALMPNFEKSATRMKVAGIHFGRDEIVDAKMQLVFDPLSFGSMNDETFKQIESQIPDTMKVGFMDDRDMPEFIRSQQPGTPIEASIENLITEIGPFKVDTGPNDYLDNRISEALKA